MDNKTYVLSFALGVSIALVAGSLFASTIWQAYTGLALGSCIFAVGYTLTDKE